MDDNNYRAGMAAQHKTMEKEAEEEEETAKENLCLLSVV